MVTLTKQSVKASERLEEYQRVLGASQPKKLIQDVKTRWNSLFLMLERILELREAVSLLLSHHGSDIGHFGQDFCSIQALFIDFEYDCSAIHHSLGRRLRPGLDASGCMMGSWFRYITFWQQFWWKETLIRPC